LWVRAANKKRQTFQPGKSPHEYTNPIEDRNGFRGTVVAPAFCVPGEWRANRITLKLPKPPPRGSILTDKQALVNNKIFSLGRILSPQYRLGAQATAKERSLPSFPSIQKTLAHLFTWTLR
jgi:hypothetical protein